MGIKDNNDIVVDSMWTSDSSVGQWMKPKEVIIRLLPHQFYVGTEVHKQDGYEVIVLKIGRCPNTDQAIRYIELEEIKIDDEKKVKKK